MACICRLNICLEAFEVLIKLLVKHHLTSWLPWSVGETLNSALNSNLCTLQRDDEIGPETSRTPRVRGCYVSCTTLYQHRAPRFTRVCHAANGVHAFLLQTINCFVCDVYAPRVERLATRALEFVFLPPKYHILTSERLIFELRSPLENLKF